MTTTSTLGTTAPGGRSEATPSVASAPTPHSMFERRIHALIAGLVLIGVAVALTVVIARDRTGSVLQGFDDEWLEWVAARRSPWSTTVAKFMSTLGGPFVMVPLRLLVVASLAWRRRWLQFGAFLGATVSSELCIGPLKALIDRPRPPGALIATDSAAFPSGHAIAASVTAIGLVVVLAPAYRSRVRWTVAAAAFAAVMAMSRTYLGAHWASDVIAGVCYGTGLAIVWSAALELARAAYHERVSGGPRRARRSGRLDVVALALLALGVACVVALHVLRRELAPASHRLSEYARGEHGSVMVVAFLSVGAGLLVLAAALWRAAGGRRAARLVAVALAVSGVGMIVSGIFPTDPGRQTTSERVHSRASAAASVTLIGAAVAWSFIRSRAPAGGRAGTRPRSIRACDGIDLLAVAVLGLGVASALLHGSSVTGVSQRLLWLALLVWAMVMAHQVGRLKAVGRNVNG